MFVKKTVADFSRILFRHNWDDAVKRTVHRVREKCFFTKDALLCVFLQYWYCCTRALSHSIQQQLDTLIALYPSAEA